MVLKKQLENDLRDALRAGDAARKRTIRMVISSIKLHQVEEGSQLDDQSINLIIQKEIKSRNEAIQEAQKANRNDLIEENRIEIQILETYLPTQLTSDELRNLIATTIAEIKPRGINEMGKVMKALMPKIQGRAPGDLVSSMVREVIQG
jgi:uncharacterized protein YqeY